MKITLVNINSLNPAKYNPRQISNKQYEDLKASIDKFGLVDPIIINSDNTVIGGHQRLKVLRELGSEKIPTVRVNLSKEDERELNIRLNKSGGDFDMDILANEFDVVDLKEWGFKDIELGFNIDKIQEDLSDKIELQYKIEVDVTSEKEQEQLYNDLTNKGYICRILTL
jgi:ParB-like chromosome segregation protein Spo0J